MESRILLFLNLLVIFRVNAQVPACPGTWNFYKPSTEPYVTWYPYLFSYTSVPLIQDNYECEYQINVPKGYSAQVTLFLNITNPSSGIPAPVQVTNQLGTTEQITSAEQEYFYFVADGGNIKLSTKNGKVQFGFKIEWLEYHSTATYNTIRVNQSDTVPFMQSVKSGYPTTITADTRVSMTVVSPAYDSFWQFLRAVLIYDGPDINFPCIGTAYDIYTERTQFVSTGNRMTIFTVRYGNAPILPMLLWQDYSNTKDIVQFQGVACSSGLYCGLYPMDASKGPVAVQTVYSSNYVEMDVLMGIEGIGTLDVFIGGVTKDKKNSVAIYNVATSSTYLPQQFMGPLKTYVLLNGKANINLTRDYVEFGVTKSYGRKGFISSNGYTQLDKYQHGYGGIQAPIGYSNAKFKVKISYADMSGETFFEMSGSTNGTETFDQVFNSTVLPDTKNGYTINGDLFTAYYDSQRTPTTGMMLRFEVAKP